jgi:hypothetical protein
MNDEQPSKQIQIGPVTLEEYGIIAILTSDEQRSVLLQAARERLDDILAPLAKKPLLLSYDQYVSFAQQCVQELTGQEQLVQQDYVAEVRVFFLDIAPQHIFQSLGHLAGEQRRSAGAALLLRHFTQFLRQEVYAPITQEHAKLFANNDGIFFWLQSDGRHLRQVEFELKALLKDLFFVCTCLPILYTQSRYYSHPN